MDDRGFFAKIVKGELPEAPITKLLGWKFLEFDASQQVIKVEMQARPEFINPAGFIHGGGRGGKVHQTPSPRLAPTTGPREVAPPLGIQGTLLSRRKLREVA